MTVTAVNSELTSEANQATASRIVLVVEYEGTRYHGFQLQADLPTVQRELETALWQLTGEKRRVITASRTDSGVHASGQVVSFRTSSSHPVETFIKALNYYLPDDIAVKSAYRTRDTFNIRRDAVSREYDYHILNSRTRSPLRKGFYHFVAGRLDIDAMNQSCRALIGEHDFASFVSGNEAAIKSTVRRVYRAEVKTQGELVIFNIVANSFLMHQVRNTVGPLIRVGLGKMSVGEFCSILEAGEHGLAWPAAPACGLCLIRVNYEKPIEDYIC